MWKQLRIYKLDAYLELPAAAAEADDVDDQDYDDADCIVK